MIRYVNNSNMNILERNQYFAMWCWTISSVASKSTKKSVPSHAISHQVSMIPFPWKGESTAQVDVLHESFHWSNRQKMSSIHRCTLRWQQQSPLVPKKMFYFQKNLTIKKFIKKNSYKNTFFLYLHQCTFITACIVSGSHLYVNSTSTDTLKLPHGVQRQFTLVSNVDAQSCTVKQWPRSFSTRNNGHFNEKQWPFQRETMAAFFFNKKQWPFQRETMAISTRNNGHFNDKQWPFQRETMAMSTRNNGRVLFLLTEAMRFHARRDIDRVPE